MATVVGCGRMQHQSVGALSDYSLLLLLVISIASLLAPQLSVCLSACLAVPDNVMFSG